MSAMNETSTESRRHLPSSLSPAEEVRGMRLAYAGQFFGAILIVFPILSAIPVLFIKTLGGSDVEAMLVSFLYALANLLQVPVSLLVPPGRAKRFMLRCWWIGAGISLAVVLLPSLLPPGKPLVWSVILSMALGLAFLRGGGAFWFPLLHDVIPDAERGRFFGKLRAIWSTHLFIFTLAAGYFLGEDADTPAWKYQAVYLVAVLYSFIRNVVIARLPETKPNTDDEAEFANWRRHMREMLLRKSVRVFGGYVGVLFFCAGFLAIPMVLYMRSLGFPTRDNVMIYSFTTFGSIIALLTAGTLVDRWGTKRVFLLAHLILCILAFAIIGVNHFLSEHIRILLTGIFVISGATMAAAGVPSSSSR
jgi:MFS family permease